MCRGWWSWGRGRGRRELKPEVSLEAGVVHIARWTFNKSFRLTVFVINVFGYVLKVYRG